MLTRFLIVLALSILCYPVHAELEKHDLMDTWVSKGKVETRTLTLNDYDRGRFLSEHPQGKCKADLKYKMQGQFVMASGTAPDCQQKNNAVAFEFYCQQVENDHIRCKIRSIHTKSGSTKEGVEDFQRK